MRMRQHHHAGLTIASRLAAHPAVAEVRHPWLGRDAGSSILSGASGLFSFRLRGGAAAARRFCDALRIVRLGVSWGGHESLAFPTQLGLIQPGLTNSFEAFDVPDDMVRLHAGLEWVEDLWRDIEHALEGLAAPARAGARQHTATMQGGRQ